jgi:hypothetical protein
MTLTKAFGLLVITAALANAQFWNPRSWFRSEPAAVIDCKLQPRDWTRGPKADKSDWNQDCVLGADVSLDQLANVKDPADFLNTRIKHVTPPTKAYWQNEVGLSRTSPMNPSHLSTFAQAVAVTARLLKLRITARPDLAGCELEPREEKVSNPFSVPRYPDDEIRRHWYVGKLNVQLIREAYAGGPVESVDKRIAAELGSACKVQ